jgi:hypothetical protein
MADSFRKNGCLEEGLTTTATALKEMEHGGERAPEAELYKIKGELFLIGDPPDEAGAERCFRIAIDVARRQAARLYELGATLGLGHLLKSQGKVGEARQMLAELYNWFNEGFEFADLKEAKTLLDELGMS